ncbi:hypothetical protein L598_006700000070 [Mesorhizobium sp. J18]|uniref:hypothetical protein n=1 Tax=Mesorhizobium sp. J18 TaxID=935263 RepID=UPI00119A71D2|nr:hypothetical protein [Mesorhizobium sp. J18]TWG90650.1 hypothetical protein L598_006700000070 [Mesorhizobium sp. J18]
MPLSAWLLSGCFRLAIAEEGFEIMILKCFVDLFPCRSDRVGSPFGHCRETEEGNSTLIDFYVATQHARHGAATDYRLSADQPDSFGRVKHGQMGLQIR